MIKSKLLFVVEAMGGGVFSYIVDLSNELADFYDIYVAYGVRNQTPLKYRDYFDSRINLIEVKNFVREIGIRDLKAFYEIKKIAKEIQPDIIHLHSSKAGVLGRWALNGKKIPMFYTPHGYSFLMNDCSKWKRLIYRLIEKISSKRNCMTICCSEGEYRESIKFTQNSTFINNAIDTRKFQCLINNTEQKEHPFTVFTLGRVCGQKNPKLFNEIAQAMPDVKFVWIGDGEQKEMLVSKNIEVTGWLERREALKYSVNADVFILTSLWEGLPISLLEAMYMRKICVVNNVIGNNSVIHNRENGYVCNSIDEFVTTIREIRERKPQVYVEKAFEDVMELYDTKVQAENYSKM